MNWLKTDISTIITYKSMIRTFCFLLLCIISIHLSHGKIKYQSDLDSILNYYQNPVFNKPLADPSVVYDEGTKKFYAFATADSWADKKGVRLIPIVESSDLLKWKYVGTAFKNSDKPSWKEGGFWAPDIVKVGDKFHLYYSISNWHDKDASIGVAVSNSVAGPYKDFGKIISSIEIGVPNSIDPFYFEDKGQKYLFWGSFSSAKEQGTYGVPLTDDGLKIKDPKGKFKIAAGDWEAVVIHKRGDYYYMFGSKGTCCEGANSKYHVLVGRSKNIKGPYLDKNGNNIAERGNGTVVLQGNSEIVGSGHNSRIFSDKNGIDWILYHGIEPKFPVLNNGVNRRVLCVDRVVWKNGWPMVNNGTPSTKNNLKPKFN